MKRTRASLQLAELRKLREIAHECLEGRACPFCGEPLLTTTNIYAPGDGMASPINADLTLHHRDGNHANNAKTNRVWAHRRCHKSFHMTERHLARKKASNLGKELAHTA